MAKVPVPRKNVTPNELVTVLSHRHSELPPAGCPVGGSSVPLSCCR